MSQSESVSVTVGAHTYQCFKLDPWVVNEITHKILNTMGPTIGELVLSLMSKGDETESGAAFSAIAEAKGLAEDASNVGSFLEKNLDPEHLAKALTEALQRLNAADSRWLMEKLAAETVIEGQGRLSSTFASHFLGRPVDMYRWALGALRSQYGFLG